MDEKISIPGFRRVPRTGVIYVTTEAERMGFVPGDPEWCNFGQGQPETGELEGAPARIESVAIDPSDQEYAPSGGIPELREAVAAGLPVVVYGSIPGQKVDDADFLVAYGVTLPTRDNGDVVEGHSVVISTGSSAN